MMGKLTSGEVFLNLNNSKLLLRFGKYSTNDDTENIFFFFYVNGMLGFVERGPHCLYAMGSQNVMLIKIITYSTGFFPGFLTCSHKLKLCAVAAWYDKKDDARIGYRK